MNDPEPKPWRSRRDEFPWLVELDALTKRERERIKRGEYELNQHGYRKLIDRAPIAEVLNMARAARNEPGIWAAVTGIAERRRKQPDTELTGDEIFFLDDFKRWRRLKYDLPYSALPFYVVDRLLLQIANERLPDDLDHPQVRAFLLESPAVVEPH